MTKAIPKGYISLKRAFGRLFREMYPEADPANPASVEHADVRATFDYCLKSDRIVVYARRRNTGEIMRIPRRDWSYDTKRERAISTSEVDWVDERLEPAVFVLENEFLAWMNTRLNRPRPKPCLRKPGEDFRIDFRGDEEDLTFSKAVVWIGTQGRGAHSSEIAEGKFIEESAAKLIAVLASSKYQATGWKSPPEPGKPIRRKRIPTDIWERAWYLLPNIHVVGYVITDFALPEDDKDDAFSSKRATLEPYCQEGPTWTEVRVPMAALQATARLRSELPPEDSAVSGPSKTSPDVAQVQEIVLGIIPVGKEKRFKLWFSEIVRKSPKKRSMTKDEIFEKAKSLGLSGRRAEALRTEVLNSMDDDVKAIWIAPGAPPKFGED